MRGGCRAIDRNRVGRRDPDDVKVSGDHIGADVRRMASWKRLVWHHGLLFRGLVSSECVEAIEEAWPPRKGLGLDELVVLVVVGDACRRVRGVRNGQGVACDAGNHDAVVGIARRVDQDCFDRREQGGLVVEDAHRAHRRGNRAAVHACALHQAAGDHRCRADQEIGIAIDDLVLGRADNAGDACIEIARRVERVAAAANRRRLGAGDDLRTGLGIGGGRVDRILLGPGHRIGELRREGDPGGLLAAGALLDDGDLLTRGAQRVEAGSVECDVQFVSRHFECPLQSWSNRGSGELGIFSISVSSHDFR